MKFLVLVTALLFVRLGGSLKVLHKDAWYLSFNHSLLNTIGDKRRALIQLLSLFIPVVVVALLSRELGGGLWGFALSLLVFLYSLGRGDLKQQIDEYMAALERDDLQAAFHEQAIFNAAHQESDATTWKELHDQAIESIAYRYFEHFFVVIFWFMLAGPAGALLYRLIRLRIDNQLDEKPADLQLIQRWLQLIEWLPVRLFGASLALVGDFAGCIKPWLNSLHSFASSCEVLREYTVGALGLEEGGSQKCAEVHALRRLYYRGLVCVVTLIALWVIIF